MMYANIDHDGGVTIHTNIYDEGVEWHLGFKHSDGPALYSPLLILNLTPNLFGIFLHFDLYQV